MVTPQARCQLQHLPTYDHPPRPQIRANGVLSRGPSPQSACNTIVRVQFPYARHRATRGRIVLVRRDRLRKSTRSKSDSKWPFHNDLFLRSERQSHPKNDRRRNHNISLGLCKPSHCPRLWRRNVNVWLRCIRLPRFPNPLAPPRRSIPSSGTPSRHRRAAAPNTQPRPSTSSTGTHCSQLPTNNSRAA